MKWSPSRSKRSGASLGDILVILSMLTLGFALVYPRLRHRAFTRQLEGAVAAVDTLRAASSNFLTQNRDWPAPSPEGVIPPELTSALPSGYSFVVEGYTLEWNRWETVEDPVVVAPPTSAAPTPGDSPSDTLLVAPPPTFHTIGGLSVHAGDSALLAGLLRHYGTDASFVRDTTWTLVMPQRSAARTGGGAE